MERFGESGVAASRDVVVYGLCVERPAAIERDAILGGDEVGSAGWIVRAFFVVQGAGDWFQVVGGHALQAVSMPGVRCDDYYGSGEAGSVAAGGDDCDGVTEAGGDLAGRARTRR